MTPKQAKKLTDEIHALRVAVEDSIDRIIVALSSVN